MHFDLEHACSILERTPGALRAMLAGLPEPWIRANEGPDTWSPFDVVGHLIDGEETDWIPRAQVILSQGPSRRFEPFDRFRHLERNRGKTLGALLDEFAALRAANIATLRGFGIGARELILTGEHPEFGAVTLRQLLATWVVHDLNHTLQIAHAMAHQYRDEVGPWRAYLKIVQG